MLACCRRTMRGLSLLSDNFFLFKDGAQIFPYTVQGHSLSLLTAIYSRAAGRPELSRHVLTTNCRNSPLPSTLQQTKYLQAR